MTCPVCLGHGFTITIDDPDAFEVGYEFTKCITCLGTKKCFLKHSETCS